MIDAQRRTLPQLIYSDNCMVCGACVLNCPNDAISINLHDINYYPEVDLNRCVHCGKCEKACDAIHRFKGDDFRNSLYYIASSKDQEVLRHSSSGGMFTEFSRRIFAMHGVVFSTFYNRDSAEIEFRECNNESEIAVCRKSKYVQSIQTKALKALDRAVQQNKWVMFVGLPCQTYPIYVKFSDYARLLCVDLYCHGVSNEGVFKQYVHTFDKNIESVDFRYQNSEQTTNYNFNFNFNDGTSLVEDCTENLFYRLFISSANMKKSCFDCPFSSYQHKSDITIGDWDYKEEACEKGISGAHPSIVSINTEKGRNFFDEIKGSLTYYKTSDNEKIQHYYPDHSKQAGSWGYNPELVDPFIANFKTNGFYKASYESLEPENLNLLARISDFPGRSVWLYGSGKRGNKLFKMIRIFYPEVIIGGFVNTDKNSITEINGVSLRSVTELSDNDIHHGIFLICVADKKIKEEMKLNLLNVGCEDKYIIAD